MMNGGPTGLNDLDYETADAQTLQVKFVSDWWKETSA
jgi:hypothetical protein